MLNVSSGETDSYSKLNDSMFGACQVGHLWHVMIVWCCLLSTLPKSSSGIVRLSELRIRCMTVLPWSSGSDGELIYKSEG